MEGSRPHCHFWPPFMGHRGLSRFFLGTSLWVQDPKRMALREAVGGIQSFGGYTVVGVWRQKWKAVGGALLAGAVVVGFASTAHAVTPAPSPGAPAVESAPSTLTGLSPTLPTGVIAASAAPGSTWKPESAVYGTASTNDIAIPGAGGTPIRRATRSIPPRPRVRPHRASSPF